MIELSPAPASLPPGRRIYAIGDIHGCARQLDTLHVRIAEDLAARPVASPVLLHIGDYVDRGADTAGVIARLVDGCPIPGMEMVNLMGNHESTMLDALSGERAAGTDWLFAGGKAALESYGIDPEGPRDVWARVIPQAHQDFLRRLPLMHREGGYAFIHAGVRPGSRWKARRVTICCGLASRSCIPRPISAPSWCMGTPRSRPRSCVTTASQSTPARSSAAK